MRSTLALTLVLLCAWAAVAQHRPEPASDSSDPSLAPPPTVNTFQGRFIYRPTDDNIRPPDVVRAPDPPPLKDFSAGRVILWCIVGTDGKAHLIKIAKHYTMEADLKAIENLKEWKFSPGSTKKEKQDVDVLMKVEVVWR